MAKYRLTKSNLLYYRQCPKRLYLSVYEPELAEFDPDTERIFDQGHLVGDIAKTVYSGGQTVHLDGDPDPSVEETRVLLPQEGRPIYEATFLFDGVLIRSDVLYSENGAVRVIEVKQSTSVKETYLDDCAIQSWVIEQSGHRVQSFTIAHINNQFIYEGGGRYHGLFTEVSIDSAIRERAAAVPQWVADAKAILGARRPPEIKLGPQCRKPYECPFLEHCSLEEPEYSVKKLPNAKKLIEQFEAEGITDIRDIPAGRLEKPLHQRIWRSVTSGRHEVGAEAREIIANLPHPRYYFDFETINFAVPIWAGTRPYVQHAFQWSCHIQNADGELSHADFLDISGDNPGRICAERLLEALGESGPVLVYFAPFEKTRLRELAELCPDLAGSLNAVIDRLFDLHVVMKDHYYHPDLKGSWSIKRVLPTIAPDLNYTLLGEVYDGGAAQRAYLSAIDPKTAPERKAELRKSLLRYCEQDTLAMVRIVEFLSRPVSAQEVLRSD